MHYLRKIFNFFATKIFVSIFVFGILFFLNSYDAEAATRTWTGTTNTLWSVASNWSEGFAPVTGDDLIFPSGASNLSNTNDLTENTLFNSITISGSGYTLSGNRIILGPGLAGLPTVIVLEVILLHLIFVLMLLEIFMLRILLKF
jgi:hypothetical protein